MTLQRPIGVVTLTAVLLTALSIGAPGQAQAQANLNESSIQGTVGLGLVGAEGGLVIAGAVDELWAYLTFPILLGAGGAVGGYFLFDEPNRVEGSVAALASGMALLIPAVVLTLVLASNDPGDDLEEGELVMGAGSEKATLKDWLAAGPGLFRFVRGSLRVAPPGLTVGLLPLDQGMLAEDLSQGRLAGSDVPVAAHLPLLSGSL